MGEYMEAEVKTSAGTQLVKLDTKLFNDDNIIFLTGEINSACAQNIMKQLLWIRSDAENDRPVYILIDSLGGSVQAGFMILDIMKSVGKKQPLVTCCCGSAASMAAVILAAGGKRYMLPHAKTMIHEPNVTAMGGTASSVQQTADSILETRRLINEILAASTGKTLSEIEQATSFDNYMNAEASLEFKMVDEIVQDIGEVLFDERREDC